MRKIPRKRRERGWGCVWPATKARAKGSEGLRGEGLRGEASGQVRCDPARAGRGQALGRDGCGTRAGMDAGRTRASR
jgi:hypothetical protein